GNVLTGSVAYGMVLEPTGSSGTTVVEHNTVNDTASGAPGLFLLGATFDVTNNVLEGTSPSGSNGALQGEDGCAASTIGTASVEASDCFNPVTQVTLNANVFEGTSGAYWTATYPTNAGSTLTGGELVTFGESGLPAGRSWTVTVGGTVGTVATPNEVQADLQNGTASYAVSPIPGFTVSPRSGMLTVSGAPLEVSVVFTELVYTLELNESGLPHGTSWWATILGNRETTGGLSLNFTEPNGTYAYTAGSPSGYRAAPGSVTIAGADLTATVVFAPFTYGVTFLETGLARGKEWWANLTGGPSFHTTHASLTVQEPNGTYLYSFGAVNGSSQQHRAPGGSFTVAASPLEVAATFTTFYAVAFHQHNLPYETEWWVNVTGGPSTSSTSSKLRFWESPGTYHYTVGTTDKSLFSIGGTFNVRHAPVQRGAGFHPLRFAVTATETGLPHGARWCLLIPGTGTHCTRGASEVFRVTNGTYYYSVTTARAGYSSPQGSFTVDGSDVAVAVPFSD
ncbi:MAG TPA: hypothetical protein VMH49_03265, partial [Thermoplasmata archaeon]|nr:hypothetical protein [Thermoplasmata archaeon]